MTYFGAGIAWGGVAVRSFGVASSLIPPVNSASDTIAVHVIETGSVPTRLIPSAIFGARMFRSPIYGMIGFGVKPDDKLQNLQYLFGLGYEPFADGRILVFGGAMAAPGTTLADGYLIGTRLPGGSTTAPTQTSLRTGVAVGLYFRAF
jgi:hypothetical protein